MFIYIIMYKSMYIDTYETNTCACAYFFPEKLFLN
jgi:hypothetical protein